TSIPPDSYLPAARACTRLPPEAAARARCPMTTFKFEAWPTEFRQINQYFGVNPQNYAGFGLPGHEGLDFRAPDGSKIFAVAAGVVASVQRTDDGHPYGIYVRINHVDNWQTTYGHLR